MSDQLSTFDCLFVRDRFGTLKFHRVHRQLRLLDWLIAGLAEVLNLNARRFTLLLSDLVLQDLI